MKRRVVVGGAVWAAMLGCGVGEAGRTVGHTVHDSAGVVIVESTSPVWAEGTRWHISAEPILTIGVIDGPPEYQFFQAWTALRVGDGTIVVTNVGSYEIRFYDAGGTFLRSVGGEGAGPGEFERLADLYRYGTDSLVVFDFGLMRYSVFDVRGNLGRTFRLQQVAGVPLPLGVFPTGHVLANWHVSEGQQREGVVQPQMQYAVYHADGQLADTLFRGPGTERYAVSTGPQSLVSVSMPFAHRPQVAMRGSSWLYGSSEQYVVEQRRRDGGLERIIRRPLPNRPVTAAVIAEREARIRERRAARGATGPTPFDDLAYPEEMPAHGSFMVDAEDCLWVQYYRFGDLPARYAVYDPAGRWLGDVEPPGDLRITDIGSDYVLGIWYDPLDVEQVRVYGLARSEER